jgi:hypothetical protein
VNVCQLPNTSGETPFTTRDRLMASANISRIPKKKRIGISVSLRRLLKNFKTHENFKDNFVLKN